MKGFRLVRQKDAEELDQENVERTLVDESLQKTVEEPAETASENCCPEKNKMIEELRAEIELLKEENVFLKRGNASEKRSLRRKRVEDLKANSDNGSDSGSDATYSPSTPKIRKTVTTFGRLNLRTANEINELMNRGSRGIISPKMINLCLALPMNADLSFRQVQTVMETISETIPSLGENFSSNYDNTFLILILFQ